MVFRRICYIHINITWRAARAACKRAVKHLRPRKTHVSVCRGQRHVMVLTSCMRVRVPSECVRVCVCIFACDRPPPTPPPPQRDSSPSPRRPTTRTTHSSSPFTRHTAAAASSRTPLTPSSRAAAADFAAPSSRAKRLEGSADPPLATRHSTRIRLLLLYVHVTRVHYYNSPPLRRGVCTKRIRSLYPHSSHPCRRTVYVKFIHPPPLP